MWRKAPFNGMRQSLLLNQGNDILEQGDRIINFAQIIFFFDGKLKRWEQADSSAQRAGKCAPQWGAVIYFPFSVTDLEFSANIELNGPGQSGFLRSIISWLLGVHSNSISSTIYQSQLRFTFALADVNVRLAASPRSLRFNGTELNCGVVYFQRKGAGVWCWVQRHLMLVSSPSNAPCSAATELLTPNQLPPQLSAK